MPRSFRFKLFIFCCPIIFAGLNSAAQVVMQFSKETLNVKPGQTITATLSLRNSFTDTISGRLVLRTSGIMLLSNSVKDIRLTPGEERTLVMKFFAAEDLKNHGDNSCTAVFTSVANNIGLTKNLRFAIATKRRIVLMPQDGPVMIQSEADTLRWRVRIMNRGNGNERLQLQYAAIPGGFRFVEVPVPFMLGSGGDTMIIVKALANDQLTAVQKPQISITVSGPDNAILGSAYCMPLLVTSRYTDRAQNLVMQGNYIDLTARNLLTDQPYQELNISSSHARGNNALDIRLQGLYFYNEKQTLLNNSYIYLKQGRFFAQAGNINLLQEMMVTGQGVRGGAEVGKNMLVAYTYLHDNNNQLRLYDDKQIKIPNVYTHAVDINMNKEDGFSFQSQLVYRDDDRDGLVSKLGSFTWQYRGSELVNVQGVIGLSDERIDSTGRSYGSGAGGLDISGASGRYSWVSASYISGARYSGLRRGFRFFDERFAMQLNGRLQLGVRYFQQANAPELLNRILYTFVPENEQQESGEVWLRLDGGKGLSVTLRPYRSWQAVDYRSNIIPDYTSISNRAAVDFLYQSPSGFLASASYDIGSTRYEIDRVKANVFQSHKINMHVGFNWISITGWGQIGPYYLREYANMDEVYQGYKTFQFGPTIQRSIFKSKLQLMGSAQWLYQDVLPGWLTSYVARGAWQPGKHVLIHADYSLFAPGRYDFSNLSTGISYLFGKPIGTPRAARYQLAFFEDRNNNNLRDPGEPGLKGVVVQINGNGMVSDGGGVIRYESSNAAERIAQIAAPAGWMTDPQLLLPGKRGLRVIAVPMKRSAGIAGQVYWEKGKYSQHTKTPNGWLVEATGGGGKQYLAYVAEDGNFKLWVPPGVYDVVLRQVQPTGYFDGVPSQTIILKADELANLSFRVKENEGGAIIKHFGKANK